MAPTTLLPQGHLEAAQAIGYIYFWGQGVAIDYSRAMAAFKVGAEGGLTGSQHQVGVMYFEGFGVDVDYKQARAWLEKSAVQDDPNAVCMLGTIYGIGRGVTPSFRRSQEYYERAIELGSSNAVENMQALTEDIQTVTRALLHHLGIV